MNNKDENGIEIKCANCHYQSRNFGQCLAALARPKCENGSLFAPTRAVIEARICELQARVAELEDANEDLNEGMNIGYWLGRHDAMRAKRGKDK